METKNQIIEAIIQRIKDEEKKHSKSIEDWYRIAANKIYATFDITIKEQMETKQSSIEWLEDKLNNVKPTEFCSIETIKKWVEQAKELHKQEIYQHAINFYLFVENDEVTDQKVEIIENLYKDYLKEFYNETFGK